MNTSWRKNYDRKQTQAKLSLYFKNKVTSKLQEFKGEKYNIKLKMQEITKHSNLKWELKKKKN